MNNTYLPLSHPIFDQKINHTVVPDTYHGPSDVRMWDYRVVIAGDGGAQHVDLAQSERQLSLREILLQTIPEINILIQRRCELMGVDFKEEFKFKFEFDKMDACSITFFNGGVTFNHCLERFYVEEFTSLNLVQSMDRR